MPIADDYDSILNYGMSLVVKKKYLEAKNIFEKLILQNKKRYEAYLNISNIETIYKNYTNSESILIKYNEINGYNREIITATASLYYNTRNFANLESILEKYINKEKNHILFYLKGVLLEENNIVIESIKYFNKCINVNLTFWPAYEKLLSTYEKTNKLKEYKILLDNSKTVFTKDAKLVYYDALYEQRINNHSKAIELINSNNLQKQFINTSNTNYLISLYDLLSKTHLKLKNYELCLDFAIKRNSINLTKESNKKFDKKTLIDIINKYKLFYSGINLPKLNKVSSQSKENNLIFLVGFPRSGTTLLDTILRSHSKTLVLEEKPYLINIRHKFFKTNTLDKILTVSDNEILSLKNEYFNSFQHSDDKLIIDKFPLNLIELGFIKKIFPNSKIILALRHPLDSILSCVLTSFKINEAMANYKNLETAAFFYNEVFNLFKIYTSSLNIDYHSIKYESVVNNFDTEINKLLNFLNINYEEGLKKFYITAQKREKIKTPSYNQVTRPIYNSALNRYKNFSEINKITPLINSWIKEFGYN